MKNIKIFCVLILTLLAFEIFNFSVTQYALRDILGPLTLVGIPWSTILAAAFCGIDFAGIARIFTPEKGRDEPAGVYYLFGGWLLAAAFNSALIWWGVSVAMHLAGGYFAIVPVIVSVISFLVRIFTVGGFAFGDFGPTPSGDTAPGQATPTDKKCHFCGTVTQDKNDTIQHCPKCGANLRKIRLIVS